MNRRSLLKYLGLTPLAAVIPAAAAASKPIVMTEQQFEDTFHVNARFEALGPIGPCGQLCLTTAELPSHAHTMHDDHGNVIELSRNRIT